MTDRNEDLVKRAETALANLALREPDWDGFASRIVGAVGDAPAEDEALFAAPQPVNDEDGELPAVTAPTDDSVPAPRAEAPEAVADLTADAASEDSAPVASAEPAESRREPVSLADLARASVARRGSAEKASIAKESLAVASQSRAQNPQVAERVHAAAAYAPATPTSVAPPPPSARAANAGPGVLLNGPWPGVVIAALGIAAGLVLYLSRPEAPAPLTVVQPAAEAPAAPRAEAPREPSAAKPEARAAEPAHEAALDLTSLPALPGGPAAPADAKASVSEGKSGGAVATAEPPAATPTRAGTGPVTAEKIVLEEDTKSAKTAPSAPAPRPGDGKLRPAELSNGTMTDRPSAGAAQAAVGAVLGAARTCVAGHPQPSSAQLVFGSDGQVSSVSVGGPAAGTPAAACIESALKKARVQPFAASSFSLGVTVRPP